MSWYEIECNTMTWDVPLLNVRVTKDIIVLGLFALSKVDILDFITVYSDVHWMQLVDVDGLIFLPSAVLIIK